MLLSETGIGPVVIQRIALPVSRQNSARWKLFAKIPPPSFLRQAVRVLPRVCFIATGAVEIETAGHRLRLGRGDMFGQLSLLSRQTPRAQVTAISHTTLLVLDEPRFRRLLKRSQSLRDAVLKSAEKRGLDVASLQL